MATEIRPVLSLDLISNGDRKSRSMVNIKQAKPATQF
jgi:hypothetical protein